MRRIVSGLGILTLLLAAGAGCDSRSGSGGGGANADPNAPLRIVTYNMHAENKSFAETADLIRSLGADVVCLQEYSSSMAAHLGISLRTAYPHQLYRDAANGYSGLGFLSRHKLTDVGYLPPAGGGWFPAWIIRVTAPGGDAQILNVHLLPPSGQFTARALRDAAVEPVHVREIKTFLEHLDESLPSIVLGDFNEPESGAAVALLEDRGFRNALPAFAPSAITCCGRALGVNFATRIDHVLLSPHFRVVAARVLESGASDHYPVIVDVEPGIQSRVN